MSSEVTGCVIGSVHTGVGATGVGATGLQGTLAPALPVGQRSKALLTVSSFFFNYTETAKLSIYLPKLWRQLAVWQSAPCRREHGQL